MLQDPASELLALVQRSDDRPAEADVRAAELVRRRFGLALPPPFARLAVPAEAPVRSAVAADGPAIAAVKWRAFDRSYRGVLPDTFLDRREIVPPPAFWADRAAAPPTRRHTLVVLGGPGEVLGYCDAGPGRDRDLDSDVTGEVYELYLDPTAHRGGGGRRLLEATVDRLRAAGATDVRLWVLRGNAAARRFYEATGWAADGAERREELEALVLDEVRYRMGAVPTGP